MTQRQRDAAVKILQDLPPGQALTAPVLAEMIDADPDDLQELLAYLVTTRQIRSYRQGAVTHWTRDAGHWPPFERDHAPIRRPTRRAVDGEVVPDGVLRDPGVGEPEGGA